MFVLPHICSCIRMWNRLYIWFFSSIFLCWFLFFLNSRTTWIKFTGFHLMNEFECEIQKVPLLKWIEAKRNEQYIYVYTCMYINRKERAWKKKKRTQFENKFYLNSNKWASDKSIAIEYCILCWKPEVRLCILHIIRCKLYTFYTRNDQDSWCTWSIWILDLFGFLFYCIQKIEWNAWNRFWMPFAHLFWLSDWSIDKTMFKRNSKLTEAWMERRHHLILFLIWIFFPQMQLHFAIFVSFVWINCAEYFV